MCQNNITAKIKNKCSTTKNSNCENRIATVIFYLNINVVYK